MKVSRKIVLRFPPGLVDKPIIYRLPKDYDLMFNVLKASVNPREEGVLVMELSGDQKNYDEALLFMRQAGVEVTLLVKDVARQETRCTHCGACVTICPYGAFVADLKTRRIDFVDEACIACGLCIKACPVGAMKVNL